MEINTNYKRKITSIVFCLSIMILIYLFSAQNGESSSSLSTDIVYFLLNTFYPSYQNLDPVALSALVSDMEFFVRKAAHFCIYFSLGIPLFTAFFYSNFWSKDSLKTRILRSMGNAFSVGVLYAIFDEAHQFFISDRAAKLFDVGIDSLGLLFGIVLIALILYFKRKKQLDLI